ncbi:L-histidine N(alpha)-methyltransferase [Streptomyces sp. NBC_01462]|uniref:L-histidine N(alpha)-methyltransferase n=1 Tax=Streptomyces sp. NBC_01462 TaxID=2903876 RepID=UPI002E321C7C|nr:L-histidine N(alpha)-methyltransferase [Streptomyces sp. NBC_01462]
MSPFRLTRTLPEDATEAALRADVLHGLTCSPKTLPPKWFYDAHGSELFDKITELPEYYPTRAEREILAARANEIAQATDARTLIELGSGSSEKTRLLLDALPALHTYVPVDVSESALTQAGHALIAERPELDVHALVADFTAPLLLPRTPGPRLVAFLGSTIGNLLPAERAAFLASLRAVMAPGDTLLLGTDLVKDESVLVAAYDDAAGVTAEFNKNVLTVVNRELGADFGPEAFTHVVRWDAEHEWIEMRLRSRTEQTVKIPALDLAVDFADGEDLRTEISAKFREDGVRYELAAAGFDLTRWFNSPGQLYGLALATPARPPSAPFPAADRITACVR